MGTLSNPGYTPDTRDPETDEAALLPSQGKQFRVGNGQGPYSWCYDVSALTRRPGCAGGAGWRAQRTDSLDASPDPQAPWPGTVISLLAPAKAPLDRNGVLGTYLGASVMPVSPPRLAAP